ncbi:TetR/AcrR family transcriptional regulator [Novosphingobium sp. MMS21-SN21R]|uniref:TetR/AcrR family transcriptional regulator n=1 Tax=Novosphingobium sp. MMS21-SN21R TaxID=2969298 RepID=UPI002885A61E|nr:TetR/AcrR family transcriptional regulator [Novosphingobium sp. MMS21-SN21R]MDT0509786.1 TetR/AcrR family transcriptional regulator [Novosphingobium sp. MMS21-SN21R]
MVATKMESRIVTINRAATPKPKRKRLNQAGRPTASELEKRKLRVMEVATQLFVERGYAATSLVDIARGAGVATRTLYQHFGDKEAIFRDVIFARDAEAALQPPKVQSGDTLYDALMAMATYAYTITYREQSIGLMRLMIAESNRFPDFMQSVARTIFANFRSNIERVLEGLAKAGLIPDENHARSAELFSDLVLGSHPIMTYTNWDSSPPERADIEERLELFIMGRFGTKCAKTARTRQVK